MQKLSTRVSLNKTFPKFQKTNSDGPIKLAHYK